MEYGQRIDYSIGLIQKDLEGEQFLIQSYKHSLMAGHTDTATHAKQTMATNIGTLRLWEASGWGQW